MTLYLPWPLSKRKARTGPVCLHFARTAYRHRHHRRPGWPAARSGAARPCSRRPRRCANNLRQLALGVQQYHNQWNALPPSRIEDSWATWAVLLLPYLEQSSTYDSWDLSRRYYEQPNEARLVTVPAFFCPARRSPGGFSLPDADARKESPRFPHTPGELSDYAVCGGSGVFNNESVDTRGASFMPLLHGAPPAPSSTAG